MSGTDVDFRLADRFKIVILVHAQKRFTFSTKENFRGTLLDVSPGLHALLFTITSLILV